MNGVTLCFLYQFVHCHCSVWGVPDTGTTCHRILFIDNFTDFFSFWQNWWPWSIDYLTRFWSIFIVTMTPNFIGQIWNLLYLSEKWSNCNGMKSKHIICSKKTLVQAIVWQRIGENSLPKTMMAWLTDPYVASLFYLSLHQNGNSLADNTFYCLSLTQNIFFLFSSVSQWTLTAVWHLICYASLMVIT